MSKESVDSIQRKVKSGEYFITDKIGAKFSDVWNYFGVVAKPIPVTEGSDNLPGTEIIEGFVGCKGCNKIYAFTKLTGTSTLAKHTVEN